VTDEDYAGDASAVAAQGPFGPPARWATIISPVAPESVVMVLAARREWQVRPLGSGFVVFGSGLLKDVVAEAEVQATDTGCRIQIALHKAERSAIPATIVGSATLVVAALTGLAWWLGNQLWWLGLGLTMVGLAVSAQLHSRLSQRVTNDERTALVRQIASALRGREVTA
jgi:hypothetical protein